MVASARARTRSGKLLVAALLVAVCVLALASAAPASPTTQANAATGPVNVSSTPTAVNLPSGISAGELILLWEWCSSVDDTLAIPAGRGWVLVNGELPQPTVQLWAKFAEGDEGSTVNVTTNDGTTKSFRFLAERYGASAHEWVMPNADAEAFSDVNPSFNPPALNPQHWGAEDTLWRLATVSSAGGSAGDPPSGWSSVSSPAAQVRLSEKTSSAESEDPAPISGSSGFRASMLAAIRPAGDSLDYYTDLVLEDGPVAFYPLQGNFTDHFDYSGNELDFTTHTGSPRAGEGPLVPADSSARIGGLGAYIRPGVHNVTDNLTYEVWVYPESITADDQHIMGTFRAENGWFLTLLTNLRFRVHLTNIGVLTTSSGALTSNAWNHIVVTRDNGTWKYYLNGAVDNGNVSSLAPIAPTAASTWLAGSGSYTQRQAYAAIYNVALTATQVEEHYNVGTGDPGQEVSALLDQADGGCGGEGVLALSASDCGGDPVNSLTGAFTTRETDLEIPGVGVPLSWQRSYTSRDTTVGRLGPGWVDSLDASLTVEPDGDAVARAETGQRASFVRNQDGSYSGGSGVDSTLVKTASTYELMTREQTKYTFDLVGKLQSKVDRHGKGLTLSYDQGRLQTVTDSANRQLTLTYNPAGLVSRVADSAGRDVEYTYDAQGRLETVTDVRGKVWTYAYDGTSSRLVSLRNPLGDFPYRNTYDPASGRATSQLDALGHETTFAWNAQTETSTQTDPEGKDWVSDYEGDMLIETRNPLGHTTRYGYDDRGFLDEITDARGNRTTMTNDPRGNMLARTAPAPLSFVEEWTYNARNDVTSYKDRRANITDFGYDADGDLTTVIGPDPDGVGPLGRPVTTYSRDAATGLVTAIRKPNEQGQATPKETVLEYDPAGTGNLLAQTTPEGNETSYGYDAAGRASSLVEPRGNASGCGCGAEFTWNYTYDAAGNRTQALSPDPDGAGPLPRLAIDFTYDDVGRLETVTNAKGKLTRYVYNAANERIKEIAPNLSEVRAEYDSRGNLSAKVDQLGKHTTYGYDDANRRTSTVDPRGNEIPADPTAFRWTYGYDPNGNLTSVTSPDPDAAGPVTPSVTQYGYDALNRRTTVTDPLQHVTSHVLDDNGNVTQLSRPDPDGAGPLLPSVTQYAYDALNRLTVLTDGEGKQTTFAYDQNGNRTAVTTPRGTTRFTFDADDRMSTRVEARENVSGCNCPGRHTWTYAYDSASHLVSVTSPDPDGAGSQTPSITQFAYDRVGLRESRTDALNRTVRWTYDELGQLTKATTPDLKETLYGYDADTNDLLTRTDALGHVTRFGYDLAHRRTSLNRALGTPLERTWTYAYDAAGNQTQIVDAKANAAANPALGRTTFVYDPLGRQTGIDYSDATPDVTFAYDKASRRMSMTDGTGVETFGYDLADRLTSVTRGADSFVYRYDRRDVVTRRTYPDGTVLDYAYADDGHLASVASGGQTMGYAYDAAGNLETTTLPSGNGHVESRSHDHAGRLTEVKHQKGQTVLNRATYTLDAVGNPTTIVRASGTETYAYDAQDRLTEVCFQASCPLAGDPFIRWTYDGVGNRLTETRPTGTTTYTYNAADQLTGRSGLGGPVTYAYDDNGNQVQAGTRTFAYDVAGRMTSTTSGSDTTSYAHDGDGKRVQASAPGTATAPTLKTPCSTATGSSGTATVNKPTGAIAGDLLVVGLAFEKGSDVAITPPSGWTPIRPTNQSSNVGYATYRKTAGLSEPASYAFSLTNSPKWSIGACAIAGADATAPIDVHNGASASSGNPSAPSITTTGPQRLVLAFYANKKPTTYSNYAAPAVERWDVPNVPGGLPSNAMASYTQATAGATGPKSATAGEQAEWVAQQIAIAPASGVSVTKYLWDVNHPLPELALERDTSGSLLRRYVHGNDLVSVQTPAGSFYYHADGLGSITNLTDAAGIKQWSHIWEPFGTLRTQTQDSPTAPANPMRFTGEHEDPTGLYHLRARRYDPVVGRFLANDPLEQALGDPAVSPYAYVSNRPTVFVDPSGLECGISVFGLGNCAQGFYEGVTSIGEGTSDAIEHTFIDPLVYAFNNPTAIVEGVVDCIAHAPTCVLKSAQALASAVTVCFTSLDSDLRTATRRCIKAAIEVAAATAGVVLTAGTAYIAGRTLLNIAQKRAAEAGGWRPLVTDQRGSWGESTDGRPAVNWRAQEKHFPGHNSFTKGRSELTADPRKLAVHAGSGQPVGSVPRGQPGFRERVDFGETIGLYIDPATGVSTPTTRGILHYSKNGVHVVPARP
jgi:RHS repeat-associated protein